MFIIKKLKVKTSELYIINGTKKQKGSEDINHSEPLSKRQLYYTSKKNTSQAKEWKNER